MAFQRLLPYCYYTYDDHENSVIELRINGSYGLCSCIKIHRNLVLRCEYRCGSPVESKSYTIFDLGRAVDDMHCKIDDAAATWLEKIRLPLLETIWLNWRLHAMLLYNALARLNLQDLFAQCARWLLLNSSAL